MTDITFVSDVTVELIKTNATDLDVARAAWVSTVGDEAKDKEGKIEGLINYLLRNRHMSPFEHGSFTFFVEAPICVFREYQRHRTWAFNEWSGRYSTMKPKFYSPALTRKLVQVGKVGDYTFEPGTDWQTKLAKTEIEYLSTIAWESYQQMIGAGIAKEVVRMVLPLNTMSSMYATVNPRNLMAFLSLRTEDETAAVVSRPLWEIQLVADKIEELFKQTMPITYSAWIKGGRR